MVVAGSFTQLNGQPYGCIARWNGTTWAPVAVGAGDMVLTLSPLPSGDLLVAGVALQTLSSTCPATAIVSGTGCPSSGGSNTLTATTLPWVDATFHATGTGLPALAIVIAATSVTPIPQGVAPLASLLPPQGQPGCDLLVQPDILEAMVTLTGSAQSSLFLPNTPPLVGVVFYHQMIPIELDGLGNWVAITSTNALQLTAGTL